MPQKLKASLVNLGVLIITCVVALALVEVALRVIGLAPAKSISTVTQNEFETIPGVFRPDQRLIDRSIKELPVEVSINSLGYRDEPLAIDKPAGQRRILLLGDSYVFGAHVEAKSILPSILQDELQKRSGHERTITINAGISGSTIVGQHKMFDRALPLSPDVVVLTFFENDVEDLLNPMWHQLAKNRALKSRFPMSFIYGTFGNTALWNFAQHVKFQLTRDRLTEKDNVPTTDEPDSKVELINQKRSEYERALLTLRDDAADHDLPLFLAIYPSHHAMREPGRREQINWIKSVAEEADIPYVSILDSLLASGESVEDVHLLPRDGHPNQLGYKIAAVAIADALVPLLHN